uniref:RING-type domain-containing protein n=1 Tax=Amphimedon queenslandica TaxID=400682 RepID=A0A1X7UXH8_AMPQE
MSCFSKEELTFVKELPEHVQLECPICLQILTDPHLVSCCGNNFCESCIERVKAGDGSCPMCNEKRYQSIINKERIRFINGLEVYCSNKKKGCRWKGELKDMSTHLEKAKGVRGCQFEEVKCRYEKCQERKQRRYLKDHEDKECPHRPFQCQYCGEKGTFLSITKDHYEECWYYPVTCPKKCSSTTMPRYYSVTDHIKECPLEPVDCVFSWAGCNVKPLRKNVHEHTADTKHMTLLAVTFGEFKKENEQIKKEDKKIKKENKKMKEENMKIMEENKKLKDEVQALKATTKANFEDQAHCPDSSYPSLPIDLKSGSGAVHFYTGPHGRHMSARIIIRKKLKNDLPNFFILLAFHKGEFDKFEPDLPEIYATYKDEDVPLIIDTESTYKELPHDVLDTITSCERFPHGVIRRKRMDPYRGTVVIFTK